MTTPRSVTLPGDITLAWMEAFNAGSVSGITGLYDPQAVLWGTTATDLIDTPAGVIAYFERVLALQAGLGLALLTRHALNLELATGGLVELPVDELPLFRSWCLVQAKAKRLSPVAHAFLAFIRSERVQISALVERFDGKLREQPASG